MFDKYIDELISKNAGKPFKRPNPYKIPEGQSFYSWLQAINQKPTLEEIEQEKINAEQVEEFIN